MVPRDISSYHLLLTEYIGSNAAYEFTIDGIFSVQHDLEIFEFLGCKIIQHSTSVFFFNIVAMEIGSRGLC